MAVSDKVRDVVEPLVTARGLDLFDIEHVGGVLRVTVEREGGVDMEVIAAVTRAISRALDEHDPISGRYTLEVSSPGLERPLRTPDHYRWAVGKKVNVKTVPGYEGDRRIVGTIAASDDTGVELVTEDPAEPSLRLAFQEIEKARTVFEWGGAPKPGSHKGDKGRKPKTTKTTKRAKAS